MDNLGTLAIVHFPSLFNNAISTFDSFFILTGTILCRLTGTSCSAPVTASAWPDTPFTTSARDVISASGQKIVFAGINWPGAAETMLPEGLQHSSIANTISVVKDLGMNVIRLTYAIEMVDDYLEHSPNQTLKNTLINALGQENGTVLLHQILAKNPQFSATTTRLEVFDAVAAEAARQHIWIHLDNHGSKAEWCCANNDGNAWFGDRYFDIHQWQRGLGFMANWTRSWPALTSISLRNELREPPARSGPEPYDWLSWYNAAMPAAEGIYGNNSTPLIFFSGLDYDRDNTALIKHEDLGNSGTFFTPSDHSFANKTVIEVHYYRREETTCDEIKKILYRGAYGAMNESDAAYPLKAPIVMTEFGFGIGDGSYEGMYAQCLKEYMPSLPDGPGGWMQWVLAGSHDVRSGEQDSDETWGLLNHGWSGWRNETVVEEYVKPLIKATLGKQADARPSAGDWAWNWHRW